MIRRSSAVYWGHENRIGPRIHPREERARCVNKHGKQMAGQSKPDLINNSKFYISIEKNWENVFKIILS